MPDAEGDSEPQREKAKSDGKRGWFVPQENPTDGCGVGGHGHGTGDHGSGFGGGVEFAVVVDGEAKCGEGDRWCGTEESSEGFGTEDVAEDSEETDDDAADAEAQEQVSHGVQRGRAWRQAAFRAC